LSERNEAAKKQKQEAVAPPEGRARPGGSQAQRGAPVHRRIDGHLYVRPYTYEIKRKAVQLYLEEGLPAPLVATELGLGAGTIFDWVRQYREQGEAGLQPQRNYERPVNGAATAVHAKITALKQEDPQQGVKRISQILRRVFCLKASPETVRQHLKAAGQTMLPKPKARKKPNPPPRRFERATPNQMWQSDITYLTIQGRKAYIIGFLDDYSRYITGLGVYRSHTSAYVLETYREAVAAYGAPKEMLTDNGRQYATWRGTTQFQKELKRDHVHHIRSTPHHPQTLGKIERFWQTLKDEFLKRAKFESLEEARERIAYWVKYYNHRRTHQSMAGMCPADRFFSIQKELRAAIERGVAVNVEELALRGKPVEPFYLVGRMGDQSVVIETDKKRMSVRVDGKAMDGGQPLIYELKEGASHEAGNNSSSAGQQADNADVQRQGESAGSAGAMERAAEPLVAHEGTGRAVGGDQPVGEAGALGNAHRAGPDLEAGPRGSAEPAPAGGEADRTDLEAGSGNRTGGGELKQEDHRNEDSGTGSIRGGGEMPGGAGGVDGTQTGLGAVPGDGHERIALLPVAGPGAFGYAGGTGAAGYEGRFGGTSPLGAGQTAARAQGAGPGTGNPGSDCELASTCGAPQSADNAPDRRGLLSGEVKHVERAGGSESARPATDDPGRLGAADDGDAGGAGAGSQPQDVLRVAGPGAGGDAGGLGGPPLGPAAAACGSAEGGTPGDSNNLGEGTAGLAGAAADHAGGSADVERAAGGRAA